MNPDRKIDPEKIQVVSITTIKGNIEAADEFDVNQISGHQFAFEVGAGFDVNEKLAGIQLVVNIVAIDDRSNELPVKGSYTHEVVMKVDNLEDFVDESDAAAEQKSVKIDGLLAATLIGIAFSTIRGIIFIRTQGTSLGTVILPVVDPKKMV